MEKLFFSKFVVQNNKYFVI